MYCIICGVKLGDTEQVCPLCGTDPLNPNMERKHIRPLYPENRYPGIRRALCHSGISGCFCIAVKCGSGIYVKFT